MITVRNLVKENVARNHIEIHFPRLTTLARALLKSDTVRNVFLYGRGTENRTLIDRLKAGYSSR